MINFDTWRSEADRQKINRTATSKMIIKFLWLLRIFADFSWPLLLAVERKEVVSTVIFLFFFLNGKTMKYSLAHHKVQLTTINCAVMHTQSLLRLAQPRFKSTVSWRLFLSQKFANCKIKARSLEWVNSFIFLYLLFFNADFRRI